MKALRPSIGKQMVKNSFLALLAAFMVIAGTTHFTDPDTFVKIVPDYLPESLLLVYVSGLFEILGGIGLLIPRTRRVAAWGLIALLVAVFPANVYMAMNEIPFGDGPTPPLLLWLRLPMQLA